ncbi:MAG: helix-turn-helix transcriptional regulator [Chloroflexota bacterium]
MSLSERELFKKTKNAIQESIDKPSAENDAVADELWDELTARWAQLPDIHSEAIELITAWKKRLIAEDILASEQSIKAVTDAAKIYLDNPSVEQFEILKQARYIVEISERRKQIENENGEYSLLSYDMQQNFIDASTKFLNQPTEAQKTIIDTIWSSIQVFKQERITRTQDADMVIRHYGRIASIASRFLSQPTEEKYQELMKVASNDANAEINDVEQTHLFYDVNSACPETFGEVLSELRSQEKSDGNTSTVEQLAKKLNYTTTTIDSIEKGMKLPSSVDFVKSLADALQASYVDEARLLRAYVCDHLRASNDL